MQRASALPLSQEAAGAREGEGGGEEEEDASPPHPPPRLPPLSPLMARAGHVVHAREERRGLSASALLPSDGGSL